MGAKEKIKLLGIKKIDDDFYLTHLRNRELTGQDISKFKYYKMYNSTPMPYSLSYIESTPLAELIEKDKQNQKQFGNPTFFKRMARHIDSLIFRIYCNYRKYL